MVTIAQVKVNQVNDCKSVIVVNKIEYEIRKEIKTNTKH
jgi:hypothetical protein